MAVARYELVTGCMPSTSTHVAAPGEPEDLECHDMDDYQATMPFEPASPQVASVVVVEESPLALVTPARPSEASHRGPGFTTGGRLHSEAAPELQVCDPSHVGLGKRPPTESARKQLQEADEESRQTQEEVASAPNP